MHVAQNIRDILRSEMPVDHAVAALAARTAASGSGLQEFQLEKIRELVARRYGFWVKDSWLSQLSDRVGARMKATGARWFGAYWEMLEASSGMQGEMQALMENIFIHETSFNRTPPHQLALRDAILPELLRAPRRIRLISLACSTGEEPYTMAMTLRERSGPETGATVEIVGLDASARALETARRAVYPEFQLRDLSDIQKARWFDRDGGMYRLKEELRSMVRFHQHNLVDPLPVGCVDVIFCRNVLIYFQKPVVDRLIGEFHAALNPGGHLFLGHSESALDHDTLFQPVRAPGAIFYRRMPPTPPAINPPPEAMP